MAEAGQALNTCFLIQPLWSAAARDKTKTYRLVLELFDEHPGLEGERLIMDSDKFRLRLYYEVESEVLNKSTTD